MLLPCTETGRALGHKPEGNAPLFIALHWLGGSARTWQPLANRLATHGIHTAALNLPGFGDAVDLHGYTVGEMAQSVRDTVATLLADRPGAPWILAGHSMGGKLAGILAREALNGAPGLENLCAVVLFSPSPPQPEPMKESTREENLKQLGHSTGDPEEDRKRAQKFVTDNVGTLSLPAAVEAATTGDLLRMNRAAFRAWMEHGSREDCSRFVGTLDIPALILAGEEEAALGPDVQAKVTLPHYPQGRVVPVKAAGHLIPIERTAEAAELVLEFVAQLGLLPVPATNLPGDTTDLIDSDQTSEATREVLTARLAHNEPWHQSRLLATETYRTLRALAETVIPEPGFDLAARVDAALTEDKGDGWRPSALPTDAEAFALGLQSLDAASAHHHHGVSFLALDPDRRTALLELAAQGKLDARTLAGHLHLGSTAPLFDAQQMKLWFEEARGLLTRLYTADLRTYARISFTGFADDPAGFTQITLQNSEHPHA